MFNRLFGKKQKKEEEPPPPDMDEVSGRMDSRMSSLQGKVKACDQELLGLKQQIKRSRGAARQRLMMRAKNVMRKKKMLDQQYGVMLNQSFNMEQVSFTLANAKDTVESVKAMKAATTELKRAFKEDINLDEIEDLHEEMEDIMFDQEEIQEVMGRAFGDVDEIDEDELMDELDGLDDELDLDATNSVPDYIPEAPNGPTKASVPAAITNDEFGLPVAPTMTTS